ncbi:hypothetical protein V1503_06125 [Bacillus sp. SCS-151]|uniref:hypothetical protein n=1 Tax=Nanhaiella sioensis TaxID=3115293 RepID=UPI00397B756C
MKIIHIELFSFKKHPGATFYIATTEVSAITNILVIDRSTGEEITANYVVTNRRQAAAYRRRKEAEQYEMTDVGKRWVASYHDPIRNIIKDLSLIEAGAIVKLLPFLRFKGEGKLALKQTEIQRIFKRGKDATRDILDRLHSLSVISIQKEGRSNVFYISANFHTIGDVREGERFTKLYQVKTSEIVDGLDLSTTGLLYKALPFFHYSEYYLCANPNEENPEVIEHLNREQLAEAIGHDADTVTEAIKKLRSNRAILTTKSGRTIRYLIHPDLMFRQKVETDWTKSVRKMFAQHRVR